MARLIGLLERPIKIMFTTIRIVLPMVFRLTWIMLKEVFGVIAVWLRGIPDACSNLGNEWATRANQAGIGNLARPIYFFMYGLALIEIAAITILLAHAIVFVFFWIFFR
jgi:hypothetical protein